MQPVTGDLFALSVDAQNNDNGLWQDVCSASSGNCAVAVSFSRIDSGQMEVGSGSKALLQGDYNLTLAAASQAGGTLLLAGTVDVYRCLQAAGSTACALRNTTNALNGCNAPAAVAPAQHAIAFSASPMVLLGNDGGLWRSTDGIAETGNPCSSTDAQHFENLNGTIGSLAEVVGFAQDPVNSDVLLAGFGALGSAATGTANASFSSRTAWPQWSEGEGGFPAIDPAQPQNWYASIGAGVNWKVCTKGSACAAADFAPPATVGYTQVQGDSALVDPPMMLDPQQSSNVVAATCRVWRGPAADGTSWSAANAISRPFGGGSLPCTGASAMVRSVGLGGPPASSTRPQNSGATVLYAGMAGRLDGGGGSVGGHVFMTALGATATSATAWTDVALSPVTNDVANAGAFNPGGFDISSVTADPHDATGATVYATVMGLGAGSVLSPRVYRSTDFGAHWLNITANLPGVPANALAVDPNDANTVYVAMDSGVYATQQAGSCASSICWSLLGTGLPQSPVTSLAVSAAMLTGDGRQGMLRAGTYGRGLWSMPLLSATPLPQPALAVSPIGLTFATQAVNSQSTAQQVLVTNTGNVAVTITGLVISGDFVETDNCSGQNLAVAASCTVSVVFAPTSTGARAGQLAITAAVPGSPLTVSLNGTGTTPASVVLAPSLLAFPTTTVGQTSSAQTITITNTGGVSTPLSTPALTGDFVLTANTCSVSLAAGASCTVSIAFAPTAGGARSGTLSVTDSAGTQTATLTGTGVTPASIALTPVQLTFGATLVGQSSAAQTITLTNTGGLATPLSGIGVSAGYAITANTCGATLAPSASCTVSIVFRPVAAGSINGTFQITDDAGTQTALLTGIANVPASVVLTPTTLTFAATVVGQTTSAQIISVANTGGTPTNITSITVSGDFRISSNTCGVTLSASTACAVSITFTPTASGTRTGTLTVIDDAGTQLASLTGAGTAPATDTLTPTTLTFAPQQVGTTSAAQQVTLTNAGDVPLPLVSALITAGPFTAVSACGTSLPAHVSCAVSVAFVPVSPGTAVGTLTVTDQFRTQTVSLSGTGLAPAGVSLTPASGLTFGATGLGLTSAAQTLTLTNNGGVPLSIASIAPAGDFLIATNTCGTSVAAGSSCTLQIVFVPTAAGPRTGTLTLLDSAGTQSVPLAGTGVDFSLSATGPTTATLSSGATATYALQLSAPTGVTGTAALTCTGAPLHSICTVTPASASLGAAVAITVAVQTGTSKAALELPNWRARNLTWLALTLPLLAIARKRRPRALLAALFVLTLSGCGAGRQIPPEGIDFPTLSNTPAGTYTLTVSASSAGLTRSVPLTLVVK